MRTAGSEIAIDSRMSRKHFQSVEKGDDRLVESALPLVDNCGARSDGLRARLFKSSD
jgi:hypothetical protein